MLGDALTSMAVILGAVLIWIFEIDWADSIVTILISIYLFVHTLKLLKESVTILMQMTPSELDIPKIEEHLKQIDGLKNIHHVHVWNLTDKFIHFECHLTLEDDIRVSETEIIYESVRKILHDEYEIEHVTIQFEYGKSNQKNCDC